MPKTSPVIRKACIAWPSVSPSRRPSSIAAISASTVACTAAASMALRPRHSMKSAMGPIGTSGSRISLRPSASGTLPGRLQSLPSIMHADKRRQREEGSGCCGHSAGAQLPARNPSSVSIAAQHGQPCGLGEVNGREAVFRLGHSARALGRVHGRWASLPNAQPTVSASSAAIATTGKHPVRPVAPVGHSRGEAGRQIAAARTAPNDLASSLVLIERRPGARRRHPQRRVLPRLAVAAERIAQSGTPLPVDVPCRVSAPPGRWSGARRSRAKI